MRLLTAGSLVRVQLGEPKEYSLSTVGVDDAGGPPVPIPNTEVKPCSAEDTWLATARENRKMPTSDNEILFSMLISVEGKAQLGEQKDVTINGWC